MKKNTCMILVTLLLIGELSNAADENAWLDLKVMTFNIRNGRAK